jgi:hypothetical protein
MTKQGLEAIQQRMIRNQQKAGIAIIVFAFPTWLFAPFGLIVACALVVIGIVTIALARPR